MAKTYTDNMVIGLRGDRRWKNKMIKNFGGNCWGPDRKHCSILPPEVLAELESNGVIEMHGSTFTVRQVS